VFFNVFATKLKFRQVGAGKKQEKGTKPKKLDWQVKYPMN